MKILFNAILGLYFLNIISASSLEVIWQNKIHDFMVKKIVFSNAANSLISIGTEKKIIITDITNGDIQKVYETDYKPNDIFIPNNSSKIIAALIEGNHAEISIIDTGIDSCVQKIDLDALLDPQVPVNNQDFMECHVIELNGHLVVGSGIYKYLSPDHFYDGRIDIFDYSGNLIKNIYQGGMITNMRISNDKNYFVFTSLQRSSIYKTSFTYLETEISKLIMSDSLLTEFDTLKSDSIVSYEYPDCEIIIGFDFSKDSKYFAAASDEHRMFIFDLITEQIKDTISSCDCYIDQSIAYVHDGKHVISGTSNGKVNIWSTEYLVNIDNLTYDNNPLISSIVSSGKFNIYAAGDQNGYISLLTSKYLTQVEDHNIEKKDYLFSQIGDILTIETVHFDETANVEIFDIIGKRKDNFIVRHSKENVELNIQNLNQGIYLLVVKINGKSYFEKFIKN